MSNAPGQNAVEGASSTVAELAKRIYIPLTPSSPPGLVQADTADPFSKAAKYALGWTWFCVALVGLMTLGRLYHWWMDRRHLAPCRAGVKKTTKHSTDTDYPMDDTAAVNPAEEASPREQEKPRRSEYRSFASPSKATHGTLSLFRWVFYRPTPDIRYWKRRHLTFPSLPVIGIVFAALVFVVLYCFVPQPLYWQSMAYGSPPLSIRAGMIAVAMTPWIIATSMKANLVSLVAGISHVRLSVLHRWGGYLCLFLALIHAIPFYVQKDRDPPGYAQYKALFPNPHMYFFGSGIAALVALIWLCVGSLPIIRSMAYELFVFLHIPVAMVYVGFLFWHCRNFLTSWHYLYSTIAIWALSYFLRFFNLNWINPWKASWLAGDEATVSVVAEHAVKVTIPTRMRWRPGQFVYLRMPGVSVFENHPFTISSLSSEEFASDYGDSYRNLLLVFRPFGGFTRKLLDTATEKGPSKTYRAYLEGPYGGMQRELGAFDTAVLFAGGSGITAVISQLLHLIKNMRDGKAVTRKVVMIWALKRPEVLEWFREELRMCYEYAPPGSVTCQFYMTSAVQDDRMIGHGRRPSRLSNAFHQNLDGFAADFASKRRNSALVKDGLLGGQGDRGATSFPAPPSEPPVDTMLAQRSSSRASEGHKGSDEELNPAHQHNAPASTSESRGEMGFALPNYSQNETPRRDSDTISPNESPVNSPPASTHVREDPSNPHATLPQTDPAADFDFKFSEPPADFPRGRPRRFSFSSTGGRMGDWATMHGRPDLVFMLKDMAMGGVDGRGILGRRTCVFVCGPPSMRVDVADTVARLQTDIWGDERKDEIFLHTENYAI